MKRAALAVISAVALAACGDATAPVTLGESQPSFATSATKEWVRIASMSTDRAQPVGARGGDGRFYVFGGTNLTQGVLSSAEAYDVGLQAWSAVADLPATPDLPAAAAGANGLIYLIGGFDPLCGCTNEVFSYDPTANSWTPRAPLGSDRYGPAAVGGSDGRIYALGGADLLTGLLLATAEAYDTATDSWTPIADMRTPRFQFGAATGADGRLYVAGGFGPDGIQSSAEAYDVLTGTWTPIASMPGVRAGLQLVAGPDGLIYAIGGEDDFGPVASVLAYDVNFDTWTPVLSMNDARYLFAAAALGDGRLYAAGGVDATFTPWRTAESYGESAPPPNQSPVAAAGPDQTAECRGGGAVVTLDGSASFDPDGSIVSYEWRIEEGLIATGSNPAVLFGVGTHSVTLRVTDDDGAGTDDLVVITVQDTEGPEVSLQMIVSSIWPANHAMVLVANDVSATDACDGSPELAITVSSDDPGASSADWDIVPNGDGTFDVFVRAERSGGGSSSRTYFIRATATDHAGHVASVAGSVTVQKPSKPQRGGDN